MTYSDALGYWENLGTVTVPVLSWVKLPQPAIWGNQTFRVTFLGDVSAVETFCWVRQVFPLEVVSQSVRYYPDSNPKLIELPIPHDLLERHVTHRSIEVKQSQKYRRHFGFVSYEPFMIKVEELAGV